MNFLSKVVIYLRSTTFPLTSAIKTLIQDKTKILLTYSERKTFPLNESQAINHKLQDEFNILRVMCAFNLWAERKFRCAIACDAIYE